MPELNGKTALRAFMTLVIAAFSLSAASYVTDSITVTLRKTPSNSAKIIEMPASAQKLTILKGGDGWSRVRTEKGNEGWMLNRYIIYRSPWKAQAQWLKTKNETLTEKSSVLRDSIDSLQTVLKSVHDSLGQTQEVLTEVSEDFSELKEGSAQYLELKTSFDSLQDVHTKTDTLTSRLKRENAKLKSDATWIWAIIGGVLVVAGWLIAHIPARKNTRRGRW
ncbi:MAG: TIGR04211 family SH3 domain-containing protein [Fibrobacterota bacterium]